jgi:hypothetical protein
VPKDKFKTKGGKEILSSSIPWLIAVEQYFPAPPTRWQKAKQFFSGGLMTPTECQDKVAQEIMTKAKEFLAENLCHPPMLVIQYMKPEMQNELIILDCDRMDTWVKRCQYMEELGMVRATQCPGSIYSISDAWGVYITKDDPNQQVIKPLAQDPRAVESLTLSGIDCLGNMKLLANRYERREADGSNTPRGNNGHHIHWLDTVDSSHSERKSSEFPLLTMFFHGVKKGLEHARKQREQYPERTN